MTSFQVIGLLYKNSPKPRASAHDEICLKYSKLDEMSEMMTTTKKRLEPSTKHAVENTTKSLPNKYVLITIESFKIKYCMKLRSLTFVNFDVP